MNAVTNLAENAWIAILTYLITALVHAIKQASYQAAFYQFLTPVPMHQPANANTEYLSTRNARLPSSLTFYHERDADHTIRWPALILVLSPPSSEIIIRCRVALFIFLLW